MEFTHQSKKITLQGILPPALKMEELPLEKLVKWWAGNDIWALVVVEMVSENQDDPPPTEIQQVLQDFKDVFAHPKGLPPEREYDHAIPTLPNAIPVNSRPYRYSPFHKDKIERQVRELLTAGLVTPSTSPYASLVLLVQKKDGTW
jgi:hypothetical protein